MPATGRDVVVLPTKKGGTAGLAGNINYETREVHSSMEAARNKRLRRSVVVLDILLGRYDMKKVIFNAVELMKGDSLLPDISLVC